MRGNSKTGQAFWKWGLLAVFVAAAALLWPRPGPVWAAGTNSITAPDTTGNVGDFTSLVLDGSGNPVVSYRDKTNLDLKVLHCGNPNCTSGNTITSPDTGGDVGWWSPLVLDANGYPVISYYDNTNFYLKVLHCDDANCSGDESGNISSPVSGLWAGEYLSLALDSNGNPVVIYHQPLVGLKVLHCDDPKCAGDESGNVSLPDAGGRVGESTSLALDSSGNPVVSYGESYPNYDLKMLHCDDADCAGDESGNISAPDTGGWVGITTSLALDGSGNPVVSYYDATNLDLKVLHCDDPKCAGDESGNISAPDTGGDVGRETSLVLDGSGDPVVSYYDTTNGDLKVLHCGDANCTGVKPPPPPVGGIPVAGDLAGLPLEAPGSSSSNAALVAAIAAGVAGGVAMGGAVWYARRRWLR